MASGADLNEIRVGDRSLLLCITTTGTVVHLAATLVNGRRAVPKRWTDRSDRWYTASIEQYDTDQLLSLRWAPLTLCGIEWLAMADTDAGAIQGEHDPQLAPTCRRCLGRLDRDFKSVEPDGRIALVAALAAQAVHEHGSAQVVGVPGPQIQPLRQALQRELRQRLGTGAQTWTVDDIVVATHRSASPSDAVIAYQHDVTQNLYDETRNPIAPDWHINWETWAGS